MKKIVSSIAVLAITGLIYSASSHAETKLTTDEQKFSYAIGFQMAQNLKQNGVTSIDVEALSQAINDVISGGELKLSQEEMQAAFTAFQEKMMAKRNAEGAEAKKAGEAFLAENKKKKDVVTLKNGLQYKVIKEGKGKKPTASDSVVAHYEGKLVDGTVFDSSIKRGEPATFPLNGVIKGWQEILPLMPVGSKWRVFIPSELAYGTRGAGASIGPNETLIFEIELLEIK